MKFFVETYGCSLNKSDSEKLAGWLLEQGLESVEQLRDADVVIFNGCGVKEVTENRMLNRLRKIIKEKNSNSKLIVFGCLSKIIPGKIKEISSEIVLVNGLGGLCEFLGIESSELSLSITERRFSPYTSIIVICYGCLGECSYCCVRNARGELRSFSIEEVNEKFFGVLKETKEVWLTSQDCGAYGKDIGKNLPELLGKLLENEGEYRVRIGMMNPHFLKEFYPGFKKVFSDSRIYKFLHLPLQSGSDKVLKAMKREYSVQDFLGIVENVREDFPGVTIATDVIVGFPGESEEDFEETVNVLRDVKPDVVNISRYGDRPGTEAGGMEGKLHGRVLKERSRKLSEICARIAEENNKKFVGKGMRIYVNEKGKQASFVGRSENYKAVVVNENLLGKFVNVGVVAAKESYLVGTLI